MRNALFMLTFCGAALVLGGCSQESARPPVQLPATAAVDTQPAAAASSSVDPSVPPVATVMSPPNETKVDPTAGRTNKAMTGVQESTAMPMPGQNNDHSAPLSPAKGASAP